MIQKSTHQTAPAQVAQKHKVAHPSPRIHAVNVYPFAWPAREVTMYFGSRPFEGSSKLHPRTWPNHIDSIMHDLRPSHEARIHTSFTKQQKGAIPFDVDLSADNQDFVKHYYRHIIAQYFKGVDGILTRKGFINETLVFVPNHAASTGVYITYCTFSLKVSIGTFTDKPELIVSYMGHSYVLRTSLSDVQQRVSVDSLGYIACGNRLIKYKDFYSSNRPEEHEKLPMLTNALRKELGMEWPMRPKTNRYKTYKEQVDQFVRTYLSCDAFRKIIPLLHTEMLTLSKDRVWVLQKDYSIMLFGPDSTGKPHENTDAFAGMRDFGPYERAEQKVHIFFIAPAAEKATVEKWRKNIFGNPAGFRGFPHYVRINCTAPPSHDVFYTNADDQATDIASAIALQTRHDDTEYYAVYLTPHSRHSRYARQQMFYHDVRDILFKRKIQMQCITLSTAKLSDKSATYALNNIAIASLGKLGGTPWAVKPIHERELVVGVSAFTNQSGVKYLAAAVCFDSSGKFRRQNAFLDGSPTTLAGKIAAEISSYRDLYGNPERLIIHYYKKMSKKELDPITDMLQSLSLDIDVYVVTISKSESADLIGFDITPGSPSLLPGSGTIILASNNTYLLFNNTRQNPSDSPSLAAGNPYGLKLHVMCTNKEKMEKGIKALDIIAQVYQFSRLYWSTGKQQPFPITQLYTERLARHVARTGRTDLPEAAKTRPFYL